MAWFSALRARVGTESASTRPMQLFDKQIQLRMGQANVKRWVPEIMPLIEDEDDPLGTEDLATHKVPIDAAPGHYEKFQKKEDGAIKVLIEP